MNLNMKTLNPPSERTGSSFTTACLASCQKLVQRIEAAREAIVAEYHEAVGDHHRVLRLALREAEALAWDTELPHLIFPTLALEKAQAVADWHARQEELQRRSSFLQLAA